MTAHAHAHDHAPDGEFGFITTKLEWLIQIVVFFALLLTGFVYIWRKGVLDWSRRDE